MIYQLPNASYRDQLMKEKLALEQHIAFYNVNTPSRDEKVKRIEEIDRELLGGS